MWNGMETNYRVERMSGAALGADARSLSGPPGGAPQQRFLAHLPSILTANPARISQALPGAGVRPVKQPRQAGQFRATSFASDAAYFLTRYFLTRLFWRKWRR